MHKLRIAEIECTAGKKEAFKESWIIYEFPLCGIEKSLSFSISDQIFLLFNLRSTKLFRIEENTFVDLPTWNILLLFSVNTDRIDTISSQKTIILRHKIFIYSYLPSESWDAGSYFPHKMILTFPYRLDIFLQISYL